MPAQLDPLIAQKLAAFGRRWRRLVLLRGVCGGLITLLGGMTLVALVDWLFILPEPARWASSAASYLATIGVVWFTCLRRLLHSPSLPELARLVERAQPELREDLLSAVELGERPGEWDSEVFRSLLQENVAGRLRDLRMENILPGQLIAFWRRAALAALAVCAALFFFPGSPYDRLMARALAPLANVERVSKTKIKLLEPNLASRWQPQGDNLSVVVEITGPEPAKVVLENLVQDSGDGRVSMAFVGGRKYSASLRLGTDNARFRIRAGDGITRVFTLETRARPHVVKFDKTFHFPAYARRAPRRVVEAGGDLMELEGTEVELKLQVNQAVKQGEITVESRGRTNAIALTQAGPNQLSARVPLKTAGTYQVRLIAAETGFENKFSPQYELRPVPDLVPRVGIDLPKEDLVAPPEEVVLLQGSANDDVGLAKVTQLVQINEGRWQEFPLVQDAKTNVLVSRKWDLLQLAVTPGDRVTTKLLAVDLKGNRGESAPLHVLISSAGFDPRRLRALEAKRALREALAAVGAAGQDLRKNLSGDSANKLKAGDELTRKQLLAGAIMAQESLERSLDRARDQIKETLRAARPGRDAADLALLGRAASGVKQELLPAAKDDLDQLMRGVADTPERSTVQEAMASGQRLADLAGHLESLYTDLLVADHADAVTENLHYLGQEQARMNQDALKEAAADTGVWERLARRQGGSAKETQLTEEIVQAIKPRLARQLADRAGKLQANLKNSRTNLEKALAAAPGKEFLAPAQAMQRGVEAALAEARPLMRELTQRADRAREELNKLAGTATAKVERVKAALDELAGSEKRQAEMQRKNQSDPRLQARTAQTRAKLDACWKTAIAQLNDRAEIEEVRRDTDPAFVADTAKASQSLAALRAANQGEQTVARNAEPVKNLEKALRVVEAGHTLVELDQNLRQLTQQERWEKGAMDARVSRPKDWSLSEKSLNAAPGELKKAGLSEKAAGIVSEAARSPTAQQINREMADRLAAAKVLTPVPEPVAQVDDAVRRALQEIGPALAEARTLLSASAPVLSDMLAGLGRAAEELEKAERDAAAENNPAREKADELAKKQDDLNKQIEEAKAAIRRDANLQDLAETAGRERARDADDAVAMLREPPPKAADALRDAQTAKEAAQQKNSLAEAALQDKKLADTLKQLAQHYGSLEQGKAGRESRQALRQAEEDMGLKSGLDNQYALAEKLGEMSKLSPEDQLKQLEAELKRNSVMRQELGLISDGTLESAKETLQRAAGTEKSLAEALAEAARAPEKINSLTEQARRLGEQARRLAAKDVPQIATDASAAQANAGNELERAKQALQQAAEKAAPAAAKPPDTLANQLGETAAALQQAAKDLKTTADKAGQAAVKASSAETKQSGQAAQTGANKAAAEAGQLAQTAKQLSDTLAQTAQATPAQMQAQAAQLQPPVADAVVDAGADITRAGRHEERLGTPQGDALQKIGEQTKKTGDQKIPETQKALASAGDPAAAQQALQSAQAALEKQMAELESALAQTAPATAAKPAVSTATKSSEPAPAESGQSNLPPASPPADKAGGQVSNGAIPASSAPSGQTPAPGKANPPAEPARGESDLAPFNAALAGDLPAALSANLSPQQSRDLARTLDQLDAAMHAPAKNGESGQSEAEQQAQNAAQQSLSAAQKGQKSQMMAARAQGNVPGEKPSAETEGDGQGAKIEGDKLPPGALPLVRGLRAGDWGRLPPKLAQGLSEGQRESVAGDYRNQVDAYFRAVADRAKEKKP